MTPFPSDEELMAGLVKGQTAMFEDLVHRYEPRLFGFLFRLTANEADAADLFQETFLRVFTKAHDFQGKGSFRSWLYAIAANLCRSHAARRARLVPTDPEDLPDPPNEDPLPDSALVSKAIGRRIAAAVSVLPPEQREVFVLKAYEELSYPEIAMALNVAEGTAKTLVHRGVRILRRRLRETGIEYRVVKNTLARFAAQRVGREELLSFFEGPVAIAFGYDDITEPAKALAGYIEDSKITMSIRGGFLPDRLLTSEDIDTLSKVPSREVLLAKVVGGIQSPISALVSRLTAPMSGIIGVLQSRIQQMEGE